LEILDLRKLKSSLVFSLFYLTLLGSWGCKESNTQDLQVIVTDSVSLFKETLIRIDSSLYLENKTYIAIPASGCSSCIKPAFDFMLAHFQDDSFLFIITEVSDLTLLERKFGHEILESANVLIDLKNHITLNFYSIYPQVFVFKSNQLIDYKQIDSQSIYLWRTLERGK
jgi:hypothetical protein